MRNGFRHPWLVRKKTDREDPLAERKQTVGGTPLAEGGHPKLLAVALAIRRTGYPQVRVICAIAPTVRIST
jgi:hypothetical protein